MSTLLSRLLAGTVTPAVVSGAFVFCGLTLSAPAAFAQQGTNTKPPSEAEVKSRTAVGGYNPSRMKNPYLTSNPPKLPVTPLEEIPFDKIQVPPGFKVEVWAHGMPGARMMARAPNGTVFVGTRTIGRVYAVMDKDGKRTSKIVAQKLT